MLCHWVQGLRITISLPKLYQIDAFDVRVPLVKLPGRSDTSNNFSALRRNVVLQDGQIPPAFRHSASIGNTAARLADSVQPAAL
jgi:hypothetical protein